MLNKQDLKKIKDVVNEAVKPLIKPLATKKDLQKTEENLAGMVNSAFNENEKRMAEGFKMVRDEFKGVNDKLDKRLEKVEGQAKVIQDALAIK